jgi:hypothetical protein
MPRTVTRREFIESTVATTALAARIQRGEAADPPNVLSLRSRERSLVKV